MHVIESLFNVLKYHIEVDEFGARKYLNAAGQLHREDGPAVVYATGTKEWWLNGQLHRDAGPAVIWNDGSKEWYQNGQRHRIDGPAVVLANGDKLWYLEGVQYPKAQHLAKVKNADKV